MEHLFILGFNITPLVFTNQHGVFGVLRGGGKGWITRTRPPTRREGLPSIRPPRDALITQATEPQHRPTALYFSCNVLYSFQILYDYSSWKKDQVADGLRLGYCAFSCVISWSLQPLSLLSWGFTTGQCIFRSQWGIYGSQGGSLAPSKGGRLF